MAIEVVLILDQILVELVELAEVEAWAFAVFKLRGGSGEGRIGANEGSRKVLCVCCKHSTCRDQFRMNLCTQNVNIRPDSFVAGGLGLPSAAFRSSTCTLSDMYQGNPRDPASTGPPS